MDIRARLEAFWQGEAPDQIPYTIYENAWKHFQQDPAWDVMYQEGLGVTWHVPSFSLITKNVEVTSKTYTHNGKQIQERTRETPLGALTELWENNWRIKHPLQTKEDYRIMTHIVKNSQVVANYDYFLQKEKAIAPMGVALAFTGRTPFQTILVDYVGLEALAYHLYDYEEEVAELYTALYSLYRRIVEIVAAGPGRFVSVLENFTADSLGPKRFETYHLPVYQECFPILQAAGKIVGTHYDGRLASCKELIREAPIDLIESFTEPPEGDMSLIDARNYWRDKRLWVNIRVSDYQRAPSELHEYVLQLVAQGADAGKQLAFEISEDLPRNWKESIPMVLHALKETRK